jgi:energy-coupling factor transporter ATP-binding protein EcfA2
MNIYDEILSWSIDKPLWWRDGLRRVVSNGNYTQVDIDEILIATKSLQGIPQTGVTISQLTPLDKTHIPTTSSVSTTIQLKSIKDTNQINAIAQGQQLDFNPNGLSVIYGDNGSGKSGYVRILKNTCRIRGAKPTILKNVYNPPGATNPQATIEYFENGTIGTLTWTKGATIPDKLNSISIFDTQSAIHYVEKENEVAFRPFGLDVLDKLGELCLKIKTLISKEQLNHSKTIDLSTLNGNTEVGKLISTLNKDTKKNDISKLGTLTEAENAKIEKLKSDIAHVEAEDPKKKAAQLNVIVEGFQTLKRHLENVDSELSKSKYDEFEKQKKEQNFTQEAIEIATKSLFKGLPLEGVGSNVWVALWNAAKNYSTDHAYKGVKFPNTEDESRCVLCQQKLDGEGKKRFIGFEEFVNGELQVKIEALNSEISTIKSNYESLKIESSEIDHIINDLESREPAYALKIKEYLQQAEKIKIQILKSFDGIIENGITFQQSLDYNNLDTLITIVSIKSKEFQQLSSDAHLKSIKQEYAELLARQELSKRMVQVFDEIDRLTVLDKYKKISDETNPSRISVESKKLTEEAVIKQLSADFIQELSSLGLQRIGLKLINTRGASGVVYHQLVLQSDHTIKISEVLSEGEYRCISLAAFLAENCTTSSVSGVIFDDPASSLDHIFRRKIAKRIVEESFKRQVVVFTHDIVFLMFLSEIADEKMAALQIKSLDYGSNEKGLPKNGPPWDAMSVKERIGKLKNDFQQLDKVFRTKTKGEYEIGAKTMYKDLRSSWERAVEEVLFNGVITRYGRSIQTQKIEVVANDITSIDYALIDKEMSKCSTYFGGHDQAPELSDPLPDTDELKKDINTLEEWVKSVRDRRKKK